MPSRSDESNEPFGEFSYPRAVCKRKHALVFAALRVGGNDRAECVGKQFFGVAAGSDGFAVPVRFRNELSRRVYTRQRFRAAARHEYGVEIGRASCRERV